MPDPRQGYDWNADQVFQNLATTVGLLKAIGLVLRLTPLGLLFGGVPCDSFGFMSSSLHGRDAISPWGNPYTFVELGNILCTRYALLACLSMARGCVWMLENPLRTAIAYMPPIQLLLKRELRPLLCKWLLSC